MKVQANFDNAERPGLVSMVWFRSSSMGLEYLGRMPRVRCTVEWNTIRGI